jgi:hypothetical protein
MSDVGTDTPRPTPDIRLSLHMPVPVATLSRLQNQHLVIDLLTDGLSDPALRRMVQTGKWSVFENIVHLTTYQYTFLKRLDLMLSGSNPSFDRYTAEADPLFHEHLTRTTTVTLDDLFAMRERIIEKITDMNDDELNQKGRHPLFGNLSILQWTEFFLLHEAHHLFTIFKLVGELRKE